MKYFFIIICSTILLFLHSHVSASCIGLVPVFGSGDTRETCKAKKNGKVEEEPEKIQTQINEGVGSGEKNINVILNDLPSSKSEQKTEADSGLILTTHQARIELAPYIIPGAYQFDSPGLPERIFINGLAWEYYLSKTLGFGILWQEWSKTGGRDFDPVSYRDASGDTHTIAFPGAINRLKYRLLIPYVTLNANISPLWCIGGRVGIGHVDVEAEYNESEISSGNSRYDDNTSLLFDLFIERWFRGARVGGALRYVNARYNTTNYLDYINLGSFQTVIYVQFTLKTLGIL